YEFDGKYEGIDLGQLTLINIDLSAANGVTLTEQTQLDGGSDDRLVTLYEGNTELTNDAGEVLFNVRDVNTETGAILYDSYVYSQNRFIVNYGTAPGSTDGSTDDSGFTTIEVSGRSGDDTFISDDTASFITINGDEGQDSFYVGTVYSTETVYVDGRLIDVVSEVAHGTSVGLEINGGSQGDYFEVNRTAAEISLFGDSGDDVFFVKALLTLDETGDIQDFQSAVVNISSTRNTGDSDVRTVDADTLIYVENANIKIDGGTGFDSLAIVGTALADTFYIYLETQDDGTEAQRIYGAGTRLDDVTNVEKTVLILGGGDDVVHLYGFDGGTLGELGISLGSGSDTVFVGGEAIEFEDRQFEDATTTYFQSSGYEVSDSQVAGQTAKKTDPLSELLAYSVIAPPVTVNTTVERRRQIDSLRSPVLIDGGLGIRNRIVVANADGPEQVGLTDYTIIKRSFEADRTHLSYSNTSSTASSDLLAEVLGSSSSEDTDAVEDIASFVSTYIAYQDRFVETTLVTDLEALTGDETYVITLPAELIYKTFKETRDTDGSLITAQELLDNYLDDYGFSASYTTTTLGDDGQTTTVLDEITKDSDESIKLSFTAYYDTITEVDSNGDVVNTYDDLTAVDLVTAEEASIELGAGYIPEITDEESTEYQLFSEVDEVGLLYFKDMTELELGLTDAGQSEIEILTSFEGITSITAGASDTEFVISQTGTTQPTYLFGSTGDDIFTLSAASSAEMVGNQLFLDGKGGEDKLRIDHRSKQASEVTFVSESWQRTIDTEEQLNLTDAMEVDQNSIDEQEESLLFNRMADIAVTYATNAASPPLLIDGSNTEYETHTVTHSDYVSVLSAVARQLADQLVIDLLAINESVNSDSVASLIDSQVEDRSADLAYALDRLDSDQATYQEADDDLEEYKSERQNVQLTSNQIDKVKDKLKEKQEAREIALANRNASRDMVIYYGSSASDTDEFINGTLTAANIIADFESNLQTSLESDVQSFEAEVTVALDELQTAAEAVGKTDETLASDMSTLENELIQFRD
ncbi:hypothetical protein N9B98_04255, partial [bacterium]|nr:hypothetical protein [bacterium]